MNDSNLPQVITILKSIDASLKELSAQTRAGSEALMKIERRYASLNMGDAERAVKGVHAPGRRS